VQRAFYISRAVILVRGVTEVLIMNASWRQFMEKYSIVYQMKLWHFAFGKVQ